MSDSNEKNIEKIYKSSLKLLLPLTPEETYAVVVREAIKLVGGDFGNLVLLQDGKLIKVYSSSPLGYQVKFRKTGFTYQAFKEKKVFIKPISEFGAAHSDLKKLGIKWCLFIPLSYHKKVIGTISINSSQKKEADDKMQHGLELFGSMASLAIRKSHIHQDTQKALLLRDSFIAMAAHELRTPVTTIYGYAQLLKNRSPHLGCLETKWIQEMYFESHRLSTLVKDMLEINRIKASKLSFDLKIHSLRYIIEKIIRNFYLNFPTRKLHFVDKLEEKNDQIVGDINKLIQVFMNLLDNAVKFSTPETDITLTLDDKGNYLVVTLADRGRGIPKDDLPQIFNEFYQGQGLPKGMGIGLFLSKNLIEKQRGFIRIQSKLNKGTTVKVRLPKATVKLIK